MNLQDVLKTLLSSLMCPTLRADDKRWEISIGNPYFEPHDFNVYYPITVNGTTFKVEVDTKDIT